MRRHALYWIFAVAGGVLSAVAADSLDSAERRPDAALPAVEAETQPSPPDEVEPVGPPGEPSLSPSSTTAPTSDLESSPPPETQPASQPTTGPATAPSTAPTTQPTTQLTTSPATGPLPASDPAAATQSVTSVPPFPPEFAILLTRSMFTRGPAKPIGPGQPGGGPEANLGLRGVLVQDGQFTALIEDLASKSAQRLKAGDPLGPGRIATITLDGIGYESGGRTTQVAIGQNLLGAALPPPPSPPPPAPPPGGQPGQPGQPGGPQPGQPGGPQPGQPGGPGGQPLPPGVMIGPNGEIMRVRG